MAHAVLPAQPFGTFMKSVATATYDEVRSLPDSAVESPAAFEEMRAYLMDAYDGVTADTSLVESDGQIIDCIPDDEHPALRRAGKEIAAAADAQPAPESYPGVRPPGVSSSIAEVSDLPPGPEQGETAAGRRRYPHGTRPMYRTTLQQLARFRTLAEYSMKDSPLQAPTAPSGMGKHYATGEQDVGCLGGASYVNVWQPFATPTFQGTFSQQWYLAGHDGTLLQTVECGWHVDLARYQGSPAPHLFVYTTRQNYDNGHSFYNTDGNVFVPYANPYTVPGAPLVVSQTDGTQVAYKMGFYLNGGAWVFYFDEHPIGYYPLDWFRGGPLVQGATRARFGGEVGSKLPVWPAMGSGQQASAGYGKAAYHRAAYVNPLAGGAEYATLSEAGSVTGPCYTVDITNNSPSEWGTYLFFGGPGGTSC